ncbi:hypothetical protein NEOLEDRAFT_1239224 [Neolentinus lepideus HHB14362 ss-1]|uniref:Uncharacterized protein n=1 Tax=Neolentinus lepideus HHB14362 ss-1 TaxID=1314782 RepID=A0A165UT99_9AGAM|nr:hypothetical protein NEOLEDRAFT_1239224 [Neolentinus lepideus HHB14362 ss-1]
MASILLRAAQTGQRWSAMNVVVQRSIHSSSPVYKKKQKVVIDDLFPDDEGNSSKSGDLFDFDASTSTPSTSASPLKASTSAQALTRTTQHKKLSPEERLKRFDELLAYVSDHVGKNPPAGKFPEQIRNSAWVHLFGLAKTPEQIQRIVELFPRWVEGDRTFSSRIAEAFIRRCEELHCPLIALDVFSDFQKHSMPLPSSPSSKPAIHQFLHSLQQEHPVSKVVQAAALFGPYKLPPATSDLVSCAMLTSACLRDARKLQLQLEKGEKDTKAPPSLVVALNLMPALQRLVKATEPLPIPTGGMEKERAKERIWLKWALARIEHYLPRLTKEKSFQGVQPVAVDWLTEWRQKSGHVTVA